MSSAIQDIKDELWNATIKFLMKNIFPENYLSTREGSKVGEKFYENDKIKQYQWYYLSGDYPRSILYSHIIPNFLLDMKIYSNSINLVQDYSESEDLRRHFDTNFNDLETKVLLSDSFNYLILIPTFRVLFPRSTKEIELDSQHLIKNLANVESPYGIWDFRKIPESWSRRWERTANASFEVKYAIKKRMATEAHYDDNTNPVTPFNSLGIINEFDEKIRSIYEFFLCYGRESEFGYFTFGEEYYIRLPPFFQAYPNFKNYIFSKFPPPFTYLDLNLPEEHPYYYDWVKIWNENYTNFYNNFYHSASLQENDIFRYALEVLRTFINIPYDQILNFLLISTFEGLLYQRDVYKSLNTHKIKFAITTVITKHNKRVPCTKVFLEMCQDQKEYWQYIFQNKYPLATPLKEFKTKADLEYFINFSFTYRNNIAHPESIKPINIKEEYLYPHSTMEQILSQFVKENFPFFILFLLRTWLKKGFKTKTEWYHYILNLIK